MKAVLVLLLVSLTVENVSSHPHGGFRLSTFFEFLERLLELYRQSMMPTNMGTPTTNQTGNQTSSQTANQTTTQTANEAGNQTTTQTSGGEPSPTSPTSTTSPPSQTSQPIQQVQPVPCESPMLEFECVPKGTCENPLDVLPSHMYTCPFPNFQECCAD